MEEITINKYNSLQERPLIPKIGDMWKNKEQDNLEVKVGNTVFWFECTDVIFTGDEELPHEIKISMNMGILKEGE